MLPVVTIVGRVGREPETITTKGGHTLTKFSVAVDRRKNDERGALWVNVSLWNNELGNMSVKKGTSLVVTGELDMNTFTTRDGGTGASLELRGTLVNYAPFGSSRSGDDAGDERAQTAGTDWGNNSDELEW